MRTNSMPSSTSLSRTDIRRIALVVASLLGVIALATVAQVSVTVIAALVAVPLVVGGVAVMMKRPELLMPAAFASMWFEGVGAGQLRLGRVVAVVIFIMPFALAATTSWRPPALQPRAWFASLVVVGWVWFSGIWSISFGYWLTGFLQYFLGWAFMVGCLLFVESYEQTLKLFKLWLWVGVPVAVLSDVAYFLVAPTVREGEEVRVYGFSGSANNFALYLVVAVAMSVAISRQCTGRERLYFRLMVPLFVTALATSGSRAGLLGLGLLGFYVLATLEGLSVRRRVMTFVGGTVAMMAIGLVAIIINPRLNPLAAISTGGSGRTDILTIGLAAAKDHWLFGLGAGNFKWVAVDYAHTTTGASLDELRSVSRTLNPDIHSLYVSLVADTGVIGLIAYLTMLAMVMKNNWDLRKSEWKNLSWAITGSYIVLLAFALQSPVGNQKMQWTIAGIVGGVYVRRRRRPSNFRVAEAPPAPMAIGPDDHESVSA